MRQRRQAPRLTRTLHSIKRQTISVRDGNGNVSEYVDATGAVVAHYEYDAFGQVVASGTKSGDFTHQFSTKQLDSESGLHYYGYRYYDSSDGRWPYAFT